MGAGTQSQRAAAAANAAERLVPPGSLARDQGPAAVPPRTRVSPGRRRAALSGGVTSEMGYSWEARCFRLLGARAPLRRDLWTLGQEFTGLTDRAASPGTSVFPRPSAGPVEAWGVGGGGCVLPLGSGISPWRSSSVAVSKLRKKPSLSNSVTPHFGIKTFAFW